MLLVLLSLAGLHCGDSSSDDTNSTGSQGNNASGVDSGMSAGDAGVVTADAASGNTGNNNGGNNAEQDAGTASTPVTGTEPECITAFTRVAQCYLTQDKCVDGADQNANVLGPALAMGNCAPLAMQGGGLDKLAMVLNDTTPCDGNAMKNFIMQLDKNKQIKDLCEAMPLTAAECTTSCKAIVPCASMLADPQAQQALGDQTNCEANCTMQPSAAGVFRCGIMAGSDCSMVTMCFGP